MPENSLGNIQIGDPVLITFNVEPGRLVRGRVASMASGVTQSIAGSLAGPLPYVAQRRQWLRDVQRIPVRIELDQQADIPVLRVGSRANVVVLTQDAGIVAAIGHAWIRVVSLVGLCLLTSGVRSGSRSPSRARSLPQNCCAPTCS